MVAAQGSCNVDSCSTSFRFFLLLVLIAITDVWGLAE